MSETAILMSTYNGAKYLEQQLDSLENQVDTKWDLIIRDDGSQDQTTEIVDKYIKSTNHSVQFIKDGKNLGASASFLFLLEKATCENYENVFFCDQDDVWEPDKIKLSLERMNEVKKNHSNKPILVHTDLKIVDNQLDELYPSMWRVNGTDPTHRNPNNYLAENNVTGCTVVLNMEACKLLTAVNKKIDIDRLIMHDWWAALVISVYGIVTYLNHQTISYRQHQSNTIGLNKKSLLAKFNDKYIHEKKRTMLKSIQQAQELKKILTDFDVADNQLIKEVSEYATILNHSIFRRIKILLKYKIRKTSKMDNLGFMLLLALSKKRRSSVL